jgi:hypothetical protein
MAGAAEPYDHLPFFYSDLFDVGYEAVGELDARLDTVSGVDEPTASGTIYYLDSERRPRSTSSRASCSRAVSSLGSSARTRSSASPRTPRSSSRRSHGDRYDEQRGELLPSGLSSKDVFLEQARRLHETIDRANLLVKIPTTRPGVAAVKESIAARRSINVTMIFFDPPASASAACR